MILRIVVLGLTTVVGLVLGRRAVLVGFGICAAIVWVLSVI